MTRDDQSDRSVSPDPRAKAVIDAALRSIGTAEPASDLQGRILTRLAAERLQAKAEPLDSPLFIHLQFITRAARPALYGVSACLIAGVIVAGSVSHSHRMHTSPGFAPPVLTLPAHGLGAASAVHPAAPDSTLAPLGQDSRGRSTHNRKGRARIAPHAHKARGVAVPAPDSQN